MSAQHPNRNKKAVFGWTMFDWANSVYSLAITTAIFPNYFHAVAKDIAVNQEEILNQVEGADGIAPIVEILGFQIKAPALLSLSLAIAFTIIAVMSPLLGAIADYGGAKKKFMMGFTLIGSTACALMYFFDGNTFSLGVLLFILAAIGYAGGQIFNDGFLPEVVAPEDYDKTSARGYAMGYIGSVLLLLFNLWMILQPEFFFDETAYTVGEMTTMATKISFITVGLWWFGFANVTFFSLKDVPPAYKPKNYLTSGFAELKKVLGQLKGMQDVRTYLFGFLMLNMGIQTVMYMASTFGAVTLNMGVGEMITVMLIIQLIAIPGSFLFSWLSKKYGNLTALLIGIVFWLILLGGAWFVRTPMQFNILGSLVGIVMGGMQALARATYSKLLPEDTQDTASFFSFFGIVDKIAIVLGTATFAIISEILDMRTSLLALGVFFIAAGLIIWQLKQRNALSHE